eukprot:scaffold47311_cov37-Attheya_sp.AAC.3
MDDSMSPEMSAVGSRSHTTVRIYVRVIWTAIARVRKIWNSRGIQSLIQQCQRTPRTPTTVAL